MWFIFIILFLLNTKIVQASGEFNISQNITYSINSQGSASVHQEINLSNNLPQIYAKEYQINLSGSNIQNITGNDSTGNVINKIDLINGQTFINLKFQNPAVGKGQIKQFFLDYTIIDFARKKGNTWEIQFPVYTASEDNQQMNVTVKVPAMFGDLSFSSIPITSIHNLTDITQLNFTRNQLSDNKILLVFGNHQLFDFKLNYYLQNPNSSPVITEIPIPPDTDGQTIIYKSLEPPPTSIKTDTDGNWLAQYTLDKFQTVNVTVTGQAKIHPAVPLETKPVAGEYLLPQKYWPSSDPRIVSISQSLNSPKLIYQYVINTLNYDYSHLDTNTRKGALLALDSPYSSLCTEFTDLFVTLARSKSISAREIEGFAFSNDSKIKPINLNSDVLHAWPEYYDPQNLRWKEIDPTWEKTTNGIDYFTDLDLNHLAFVIHGLQSDYPAPPGSYKKDPNDKSVFVSFATQDLQPKFISPQISLNGRLLTIKNPNLFNLHSLDLNIINFAHRININNLPPLSSSVFTIPQQPIWQSILPRSRNYQISLTLKETTNPISYQLANTTHYLYLSVCIGMIIFLLCIGGIILTASRKHYEKNT